MFCAGRTGWASAKPLFWEDASQAGSPNEVGLIRVGNLETGNSVTDRRHYAYTLLYIDASHES